MRHKLVTLSLAVSLVLTALPERDRRVQAAPVQGGTVRIVGPRGEATPVVNENNQLALHVEGAGTVSRWISDSPEVATVSSGGVLTGRKYGFATITAETGAGVGQVIVVVVRKTPRRASRAQGDTKADTGGNVYLSSPQQHVIYRAGASGSGVLAGTIGQSGYQGGAGTQARFNVPTGMGVDQSARGGVYVADSQNHCIRRIGANGSVEALVGMPQHAGRMVADRTAMTEAVLDGPRGVVVVGGNLMVADTENHCVWYVDLERREVRIVAGEPGAEGTANGRGRAARFNRPSGLAVSTDGRLVAVADTGNNVVRLIQVGVEEGKAVYDVTTLGQASSRRGAEVSKLWGEDRGVDVIGFDRPESVSIDGVGNVYVIDAVAASVVSRREDAVEKVDLAQAGTLGDPASVTLSGTQAFVLDGAATTDDAVNVVEVGAPEITRVTPEVTGLAGGETIIIKGNNFAPESEVTIGGAVVTDFTVESARRIRLVAPAQSASGVRTVSVATRGGLGQTALEVRAKRLDELAPGEITTVAGGIPYIGDGGPATVARTNARGPVVDGSGNIYFADPDSHRIRRVDVSGRITTVAGTGEKGFSGDGGSATSARLKSPNAVSVDGSGNLYIVDGENHRIRRVDATGRITTVAGTGEEGYNGDDKPATSASLNYPFGVSVDASGNVYIADTNNFRIRRVDSNGQIRTIVGTGEYGFGGDGGPATSALLASPSGVEVDASGYVYIGDSGNSRIRRVDLTGRITTIAGNGNDTYNGDDLPATSTSVGAGDLAVDGVGNVFFGGHHRVRRVDGTGQITTIAGTGEAGYSGDGGPATSARIGSGHVAIDGAGNVYIAGGFRIRRVDASGRITTLAGTGEPVYFGDDRPAENAQFGLPLGVAVDASGNLYMTDPIYARVWRVDVMGRISRIAGTGVSGYNGDDQPATSALLRYPSSVAADASGNVYIADSHNQRIRRVDASGRITTIAGTGEAGYDGDHKPATSARLFSPRGVAVDSAGNVYIADSFNARIRRVDGRGRITTIAGTGEIGDDGDGGPATSAQLVWPQGVTVDSSGNVYIADPLDGRIRRVDATGRIMAIAGTDDDGQGYNGDDRPATSARLASPYDVAVDEHGNVYIADTANHRIRRVDTAGLITTIAGTGADGFAGDNGPGSSAQLNEPYGVAVDKTGNIYVADLRNGAIRAIKRPTSVGGPSFPPRIDSATYRPENGKLKITGAKFGTAAIIVTINGTDVSMAIRNAKAIRIVLEGSAEQLGLRTGANLIVVTVGGMESNIYELIL